MQNKYLGVLMRVIFCAGIASIIFLQNSRPVKDTLISEGYDSAHWQARIVRVGGPGAYAEFSEAYKDKNPSEQHGAAHIFGDAVYHELGLSGIAVCDSRFSYGCFHEFIGRAITSGSLDVVPQLDIACNESAGCVHGIGHGVLSYLGYGVSNLATALRVCDGLSYDDPFQGCDAGVYMEYNLRTMLGGVSSTTDTRIPHDEADWLVPCDRASPAHARACYLWLPQWWWVYLTESQKLPSSSAFKKMAMVCQNVRNGEYKNTCIEGVGLLAPAASGYDAASVPSLCEGAFRSESQRLLCRAYAASVFFTTSSTPPLSVCDTLSGTAFDFCRMYARGEASISQPRELPVSLQ